MTMSHVELQTHLDALKTLQDNRLSEQRKVNELKKQEDKMRDTLIGYLDQNPDVNGIIGKTHKALLKPSEVCVVTDYAAFQQHLIDSDEWDLAQTLKPAAEAMNLRREDGVEVPGTEWVTIHKLSITKL